MGYIRATVISAGIFMTGILIGDVWFFTQCEPIALPGYAESHIAPWQCVITHLFPVAGAIIGGSFVGFVTERHAFWLGLIAPSIGLLALHLFTAVLDIWYGSNLLRAAIDVIRYCLLPSAFAGWFVQMLVSLRKRRLTNHSTRTAQSAAREFNRYVSMEKSVKYIGVIILILVFAGCSKPNKFESEFEKPKWFNDIEAPSVHTSNEVSALWRSEKRCCEDENTLLKNNRVFYKACFNAISEHYEDEELVVKCLWLMDIGAESDQRVQLTRFLVQNFSHHKNSISGCTNCMSGDTVARETLTLARYESRLSNSKDSSIHLIENVLDNRLDEISYWVQAELYEYLGKLYLESGLNDERLERMKEVFDRFNNVKKYNEPLERRYKSFEKVYQVIIEETHNNSLQRNANAPAE